MNAADHFAFIAGVTERLEMITTIMILPQRQTVLAAKQAAQVAFAINNRFKMGIGVGWNEVGKVGLNEEFRNRGRRQSEQVDLMRRLWTGDSLDYHGEFHRIDKASIKPQTQQGHSYLVWFSSALLDRCAKLGDGWIPLMGANEKLKPALIASKAAEKR